MMHANKQQNNARRRAGLVLALIIGLISVGTLGTGPIRPTSAQADSPRWSHTGSLNTARRSHTATLLSDGKVLVAGGASETGPLNSAELYDPITGAWSVTGNLNMSRYLHTATLLEDGRVLVAGGLDTATNTAEVYDPATGLWSLIDNLNVGHYSHTATLLRDGKVLIAGGGDTLSYSATNTAEVYNPTTGTWSLTGNLSDGRLAHTATLLTNGKVLAAGGAASADYQEVPSSAELYDPSTETWSLTGSLNTERVDYAAVLLPNGDVLVAGGDRSISSPGASEVYKVAKGKWSHSDGISLVLALIGFSNHTLTLLQNGKALLAGGAIWPGPLVFKDAIVYNPATGSWKRTANLNTPRYSHTATLLPDGKVLVVGGVNGSFGGNFLRNAELYHPEVPGPAPRIISASVAGKKLIVAGENFDDGAVILINGEKQKTRNDDQNPQTTLIGKKAAKKIKPGDRVQVRNPDGTLSEEFVYAGS